MRVAVDPLALGLRVRRRWRQEISVALGSLQIEWFCPRLNYRLFSQGCYTGHRIRV